MGKKALIHYIDNSKNKIKKSIQGVNNTYCLRINIIKDFLKREPTRDEQHFIAFDRKDNKNLEELH